MTEETTVQAEEPETQETAVPEQAEPESDEGQESPPDTEQDDEGKSEPPKESRAEKRIKQLTWEAREAQRKLAELEAWRAEQEKISAPKAAKPKPDDYETNEEFVEALSDWKVEQKLSEKSEAQTKAQKAEAEQKAIEQSREKWTQKEEAFAEKNPDYDEVVAEFTELLPKDANSAAIVHKIISHENGPEIIYALAKDLDLAEEIFSRPHTFAARKLDQIAVKTPPPKKLPNPPSPVRSGTSGAKPLHKKSGRELVEWLNS